MKLQPTANYLHYTSNCQMTWHQIFAMTEQRQKTLKNIKVEYKSKNTYAPCQIAQLSKAPKMIENLI